MIIIRDAKLGDSAAITAIYNYYIEYTYVSFELSNLSEEEVQERMQAVWGLNLPYLVLEESGRSTVLGYAYLSPFHERLAYKPTVLSSIYLAPAELSKGLGSSLLSELIKLASMDDSIHSLIATISLPNPSSEGLHKKMGFHEVARLKEVGYKFAQWVDVAYMQRILP